MTNGCVIYQDAYITQALRTNVRVTLQMGPQPTQMTLQQPGLGSGQQVLFGQLAKPSSPRETEGTYWGYTTRLATSLSQVFQDCPFEVCCTLMHVGLLDSQMPYLNMCLQNLKTAMQSCASLCGTNSHCLQQVSLPL